MRTLWQWIQERSYLFLENAFELWQNGNGDQRAFLIALLVLLALFLSVIISHWRWRYSNRRMIRKLEHFKTINNNFVESK